MKKLFKVIKIFIGNAEAKVIIIIHLYLFNDVTSNIIVLSFKIFLYNAYTVVHII